MLEKYKNIFIRLCAKLLIALSIFINRTIKKNLNKKIIKSLRFEAVSELVLDILGNTHPNSVLIKTFKKGEMQFSNII